METRKGASAPELLIVIYLAVLLIGTIGWIMNIVKFCRCDFDRPIKAEVCRGIGIIVPPVGAIEGFLTINDDPTKKDKN